MHMLTYVPQCVGEIPICATKIMCRASENRFRASIFGCRAKQKVGCASEQGQCFIGTKFISSGKGVDNVGNMRFFLSN